MHVVVACPEIWYKIRVPHVNARATRMMGPIAAAMTDFVEIDSLVKRRQLEIFFLQLVDVSNLLTWKILSE